MAVKSFFVDLRSGQGGSQVLFVDLSVGNALTWVSETPFKVNQRVLSVINSV